MLEETRVWKILLIDDDEDDYLITRVMLADTRGAKVHLTWAASYAAGYQILIARQPYDAVLGDYELGVHTGLELMREAIVNDYPAPIILLTGRGSYEVDVEAMQAGASIIFLKMRLTRCCSSARSVTRLNANAAKKRCGPAKTATSGLFW